MFLDEKEEALHEELVQAEKSKDKTAVGRILQAVFQFVKSISKGTRVEHILARVIYLQAELRVLKDENEALIKEIKTLIKEVKSLKEGK